MKDSYEYKWSPYDLLSWLFLTALIFMLFGKYKNEFSMWVAMIFCMCIAWAITLLIEFRNPHDKLLIDRNGIKIKGEEENGILWENVERCEMKPDYLYKRSLHYEMKLYIFLKDKSSSPFEINLHDFRGPWWRKKQIIESFIGKEDEYGNKMVFVSNGTKFIVILFTILWTIFVPLLFLGIAILLVL